MEEIGNCSTNHCPIDGKWKEWENWSECSVTCGGAIIHRKRTCEPPQYGGKACSGEDHEEQKCALNKCPIPGDWLAWTGWGICSKTCGGGTLTRERECNMKTHGDLTGPCEGKAKETEECNSFDCRTRKSCSVLYGLGLRDSVWVIIDPDGQGGLSPFKVFCNMTVAGGLTQVGHDRTEYTTVSDWEGPCDYYASVTYDNGVTVAQMVALMDISASCRQYISWKCKSAVFEYTFDKNDPDAKRTYWKTRDGKGVKYFGGATPGTANCACGEDMSCFIREKKCNCDTNDQVWREDAGYLTHIPDLPVTGFCAGDTAGEEEEGKYMIGPLTCTGGKA